MSTHDIDRDVWHNFVEGYRELDAERFLSIFSADLIRAAGPAGQVQDFDEYAAASHAFMDRARTQGDRFAIEFRFTERLHSDSAGSERGVFRLDVQLASGEERTLYGGFHVFLRREGERWMIVVDYDSDEGGRIDADAFAAAAGSPR